MAVCGDPQARHGIILSKNELAKAAGVKTAEAIWQAKEKCPELVLVGTDFPAYLRYAEKMRRIYADFSDRVEPFGLDEAWLDVSDVGAEGKVIADEIRARAKKELGLTVSVGVSFGKVFAKLASDLKKPDATHLRDGGKLPQGRLAAASARAALCGAGHGAAAARAQYTHHWRHRRAPSGGAARHAGQARRDALDVCQRLGMRGGYRPWGRRR